jgi:hypothetical protein
MIRMGRLPYAMMKGPKRVRPNMFALLTPAHVQVTPRQHVADIGRP